MVKVRLCAGNNNYLINITERFLLLIKEVCASTFLFPSVSLRVVEPRFFLFFAAATLYLGFISCATNSFPFPVYWIQGFISAAFFVF